MGDIKGRGKRIYTTLEGNGNEEQGEETGTGTGTICAALRRSRMMVLCLPLIQGENLGVRVRTL